MAITYCDVDADLRDVFADISSFQENKIIRDPWYTVSGKANTYQTFHTGFIDMVFDDGQPLTIRTSTADVQTNAGSFYYTSNILYVHAVGSDNLTTATITISAGVDWDTFKDKMRDKAMQFIDAVLNPIYPTPLMPRLIKTHDTDDYDYVIVQACALLTCAYIVRRRDPNNKIAVELMNQVWNPDRVEGEPKGLLDQLKDGDLVLQDQLTAREVGGFNVHLKTDNTATAYFRFYGTYTGSTHQRWRLQIDGAGAEKDATYKLSYDTGTTWDIETEKCFDTDNNNRRVLIGGGIYCIFFGTFAEGDYADLELYPLTDEVTHSRFGVVDLVR